MFVYTSKAKGKVGVVTSIFSPVNAQVSKWQRTIGKIIETPCTTWADQSPSISVIRNLHVINSSAPWVRRNGSDDCSDIWELGVPFEFPPCIIRIFTVCALAVISLARTGVSFCLLIFYRTFQSFPLIIMIVRTTTRNINIIVNWRLTLYYHCYLWANYHLCQSPCHFH